jgi:hypothetical protein
MTSPPGAAAGAEERRLVDSLDPTGPAISMKG